MWSSTYFHIDFLPMKLQIQSDATTMIANKLSVFLFFENIYFKKIAPPRLFILFVLNIRFE